MNASSAKLPSLDVVLQGIASAPAMPISDLTLDSRAVRKGGAFLARKGTQVHGLKFADQAVQRGASAILYEPAEGEELPASANVVALPVPAMGEHLGEIAARFFGAPSQDLALTAITGTNGKTTVAWLLANALQAAGLQSAYMGTIGRGFPGSLQNQLLTTPDVIECSRAIREFLEAGAEHVVMEASSHALDQERLQGLKVACAVFTNLSQDHFDYHGSLAAYQAAKARLFSRDGLEHRVINIDTDFGRELAGNYPGSLEVSALGRVSESAQYVCVKTAEFQSDGISATIETHLGELSLRSGLLGTFNLENLCNALGALLALGLPLNEAGRALSQVQAPAGRMQRIQADGWTGAEIVVDFAHTPAGLEAALKALRAHAGGNLWLVFGCGGDRDRAKRSLMGELAFELADHQIVTSDNPRSESPLAIAEDVLGGFENTRNATVLLDRREAIRFALSEASAGDTVLIAGKGHESTQEISGVKTEFDDVRIAESIARELAA